MQYSFPERLRILPYVNGVDHTSNLVDSISKTINRKWLFRHFYQRCLYLIQIQVEERGLKTRVICGAAGDFTDITSVSHPSASQFIKRSVFRNVNTDVAWGFDKSFLIVYSENSSSEYQVPSGMIWYFLKTHGG